MFIELKYGYIYLNLYLNDDVLNICVCVCVCVCVGGWVGWGNEGGKEGGERPAREKEKIKKWSPDAEEGKQREEKKQSGRKLKKSQDGWREAGRRWKETGWGGGEEEEE